ncbi:hypothetical protein HMPREF1008_01344 [Olsenella sp. oral taxon 809 str. F0356]|uniref:hypothetical protein n=1 Tax=Olsenella sp. oral taxon 809 TaxID=661086 RepID=UPI000231F1AE|nr:hypothetical protein [Olsenella sp. oral taxon 809]EHF01720.1 hypothetical protein HMPREF1008_01344 [Olsenella sp. oral taxon 809 str. F0356]
MDKELFDYTAQKVDELLAASSSSEGTLKAAQTWKDAVAGGIDDEALDAQTKLLLDALDEHHTTIDEVIAFASGPARELFGEEAAGQLLVHQQERKAEGARYCDCAACTAAQELLARHGRPVL